RHDHSTLTALTPRRPVLPPQTHRAPPPPAPGGARTAAAKATREAAEAEPARAVHAPQCAVAVAHAALRLLRVERAGLDREQHRARREQEGRLDVVTRQRGRLEEVH